MNVTVILVVYISALVIGCIVGIVVGIKEPVKDKYRSVLTTEEYYQYIEQSQRAAAIAHGGGKLCPDKTTFEVIKEGAKNPKFKFPDLTNL